jgi:hypothetical protein
MSVALALSFLSDASKPYAEAGSIGRNVSSFKELSARFASLARAKGAVYAFTVLQRAKLPPNTDLHLLGHVVGDELYKQKGVAGIADCTQDFRNACSHSIVIGALTEFGGEKALSLIRSACTKAPGGVGAYTMCYHGLGHGVFAFYEYDLGKAISFCKRTGTTEYRNREYIECVGGAVMELMGGGGHDHDLWLVARNKYLNPADPLAPCMSSVIPDAVKAQCLTYLTPRLFELAGADLGAPDPTLFPKAFGFCDVIPKVRQGLRDACMGGFGKEFIPLAGARDIRRVDAFSDDEYRTAAEWCMLSAPDDGKRACVKQALASIFWGGENDPQASFRFCKGAPENLRGACYEELASDIAQYTSGSRRAELCAQIPEQSRATCIGAGSDAKNGGQSAIKAEETQWRARIAAVGGKTAYEEFAQSVASLPPSLKHENAHAFGGALYEEEGIPGLSACDSRFSYGCFHEFLGRAIARHGLSVVSELNEKCSNILSGSPLSCQHGIGHGIEAYLGYSFSDLTRALAICRDLPHNDFIGGCYAGVFMEYNLRTMLGSSGTPRTPDGDIYAPCDWLEESYLPSCAFSQPQWWHQGLFQGAAREDVFAKLGEYCGRLVHTPALLRVCYQGIGALAGSSAAGVPSRAAQLCDAVSHTKPYALYCTSYAANTMGIDLGAPQGLQVCAGLPGNERAYCEAYARNEANILNERTIEQL